MADAAVRSKKPATSRRTPADGAPTAPHTAAEASEPRIDIAAVTDLLLGTWADTRREAREMIKDPAFWRIDGLGDGRAPRARARASCTCWSRTAASRRAFPTRVRRRRGQRRQHRRLRGARARPIPACRSSRACSGACSARRSASSAPRSTTTSGCRASWTSDPRRVRDDRDRSRIGCRSHRHDRDLRPRDRGVRHPHAVPRRPGRTTSATRRLHGMAATVFAQLITDGVNHGVHCFYVPLRDENENFLPGIGGEDDGAQGRPERHRQRPAALRPRPRAAHEPAQPLRRRRRRRHLLERRSTAPAAASSRCSAHSCRVASRSTAPRRRATALGARTSRSRTRNQRRQFDSGSGTDEVVLLDYGKHQRRLLPRLATTYAQFFAHDEFLQKFDGVFSGKHRHPEEREDLETLAAALKPLSTWNALDTAAGSPRGLRRRRLPRREPPGRACAPTSTSTSRSRATTTCCCSSSASACSPTTPSQFKGKDAAALARFAVAQTAGKAVPRRGPAPARPVGGATSDRPPARSSSACARPAARAARGPRAADGGRYRRRGCARHPS